MVQYILESMERGRDGGCVCRVPECTLLLGLGSHEHFALKMKLFLSNFVLSICIIFQDETGTIFSLCVQPVVVAPTPPVPPRSVNEVEQD